MARIERKRGEVTLVDTWYPEDLMENFDITHAEASAVLEYAAAKHDANVGYNWEYFEVIIGILQKSGEIGENHGELETFPVYLKTEFCVHIPAKSSQEASEIAMQQRSYDLRVYNLDAEILESESIDDLDVSINGG